MNHKQLNPFSTPIRTLYQPVQPAILQAATDVQYREFLPDPRLREFIYCYWQLKAMIPLTHPFTYRVIADGCIDIFVDLDQPQDSFVMGFCKQYTEFPLEHSFNYLGIRFLPAMFPQLFKINASVLSNRFEELQPVAPQTAAFLANKLNAGLQVNTLLQLLDDYFLQLATNITFHQDNRLYDALQFILERSGNIAVETQLDTGISPRQLRRLFEYYIGDSAKTFSKIVRFQHLLRSKPSDQSLNQLKSYFDAGYYDQAHFIKEFKNFYGLTPGNLPTH